MSRKEGVIHLGKSRSPSRFRGTSPASHMRVQSMRTSRSKDPLQESNLNQSMHVSSQPPKPDTSNYAHTFSGFFPPNPRSIEQIVVKQNIKMPHQTAIIQGSPHKRVIVSRPLTLPTENSPMKNESSQLITRMGQNEALLQRKVKVLENRIQELHQEKQNCVIRSHEENKRLVLENSALQNRLATIENTKNQQISSLRQEITNLRNMANSHRIAQVEVSSKPTVFNMIATSLHQEDSSPLRNKNLRNAAYVDDEESINNLLYKLVEGEQEKVKAKTQTPQVMKINSEMEAKVKELSIQNQKLKTEINDLKQSLIQSSAIIEENNRKIVQNYDSKIVSLQQENKDYAQKVGKLGESVKFYQQQTEHYVQRTMQKSQQMMRMEDKYKGMLIKLEQKLSQSKPIEESQSAEVQTQDEEKTDSCQRCRELIKTLVKLNQKTFSKTT